MKRLMNVLFIICIIFISYGCKQDEKNYLIYNLNYETTNNIIKYDIDSIEELLEPSREGYTFKGWSTDKNTFVQYQISELKESITLYAFWIKQYIVTYDGNGLDYIKQETYDDNTSIFLPTLDIKRDGYTLTGYKLSTNEEILYPGNSLCITEDIVLYCVWTSEKEETKKEKVPDLNIKLSLDKELTYKDITFKIVNKEKLKLDLYLPKLNPDKKSPIVFFFFGGGWFMGDKSDISYFSSIINRLTREGMAVCAVNYRLCDLVTKFPLPVEDCFDGIRFIVKYADMLNIDVNNMGSIGPSAGGHLSLLTGFAQNYFKGDKELAKYIFKLKFVVDLFGPAVFNSDVLDSLSSVSMLMLQNFIGISGDFRSKCYEASPSTYLNNNTPNILIIHGKEDSIVPTSQSVMLYEMLLSKGCNASIILVEGSEHTLYPAEGFQTISPSLSEIFEEIYLFLVKQISN